MRNRRTIAVLLATGAAVVVLLAIVSFWGDVRRGELPQTDLDRIQGKWKIVSAVFDGKAIPKSELAYWIFEGEEILTLDSNGNAIVGPQPKDYRLDENHEPGWVDLDIVSGKPDLAIYEFNGDTLRICLSSVPGKRPTALESKAGSRNALMVLKRE